MKLLALIVKLGDEDLDEKKKKVDKESKKEIIIEEENKIKKTLSFLKFPYK